MRTALHQSLALLALAQVACVRPPAVEPEPEVVEAPVKPDAGPGPIVIPYDAGVSSPAVYAGEPCPPETFGQLDDGDGGVVDTPDGAVVYGLCAVTRSLRSEPKLNGKPVPGLVTLEWAGGGYESIIERVPDPNGRLDVRVLRGRYDEFRYQPSGVFPTHKGFETYGPIDMTRDQSRTLAVNKWSVRGSAVFGGLPFTPSTNPHDVQLDAYGLPQGQIVMASSAAGAYEVSLLEGVFALFLSSPPQALYGTELLRYNVSGGRNLVLDRELAYDIEVPTRLLEGSLTIDGQAFPDRRPGADFHLDFTVPGERDATVRTHHEGGLAEFSSMVPAGKYAVKLDLVQASDAHLPSQVWGYQLSSFLDLTRDNTISANFNTFWVEGGVLVDGRPPRPNPAYDMTFYMFGFAGAAQTQSGLIYEVPMDSANFQLRVFPGNYYVAMMLDDELAENLVAGFYVVDRYFQVHGNTRLPVNIETREFTGRLLVDGAPPPEGRIAGTLWFRNRDLENQNSFYWRRLQTASDGSFRVRLPKGEYEVFFIIDSDTFPDYASGRQLMIPGLDVKAQDQQQDLLYDTIHVTGPIRVDGQAVADNAGGPDVGLKLRRHSDSGEWSWGFQGGKANYTMRVPKGDYALDFVIHRGAIDGVAWGNAPMGLRMSASKKDDTPTDVR